MVRRIAVVDNEKLRDMDKKRHIQSLCPVNRAGTECIYFEGSTMRIDEGTCIGCGICVKQAPQAIHVINLPEQLTQDPVHRYGPNGFALYSLPLPKMGLVTGILGRNGIGKSTALQVLAGLIEPNLGGDKGGYDALLDRYKGTEAQTFFGQLREGKVTVAYKPQQVDLIPKQSQGTVSELLSRVDEKGEKEKIVDLLELGAFLDQDISTLSGGELQRVAIAATVLKKANVYFFDEPTSFLDIKQRLRVSRFIRSLANESTAVMVVEHDLIILDSMTDNVHIMYGFEGVFGVASGVKATRNGINTYLSGYLKEENMRFRDKPITFASGVDERGSTQEEQVSWKKVSKTLGGFSLSAGSGSILKDDIIGILGENGIGKTSFVKLLAGADTPDEGTISKKVTVSYKPQYLDTSSETPVAEVLADALSKHHTQLIAPLDLEPLLDRRLCDLSGGELQRVSIVACLARDAQLYLMDEPSAYLDVEQRLKISKIVRDFITLKGASSLIVDHDLIFLDVLSERLMVFDGTPAKEGHAHGPMGMAEGMTRFLQELGITFRRDEETLRPRVNKEGSVKDREQKKSGKYYYR